MQTATQTSEPTAAPTRAPIQPGKRIATIHETAQTYPFSEAALRDLKFRAFDRTNSKGEIIKGNGSGKAGAWIQVGRKVLLDLDAFDAWIASHTAATGATPAPKKTIKATDKLAA